METTATSTSNIIYIIWIDPNIYKKENSYYLKELKQIKNTIIYCFIGVMDALRFIKNIKFSETNIIISGSLYTEFIEIFKENITDIFIIPKIIIFTSSKERFIENNKNYNDKHNSFFNLGGIQTSFNEIKKFILKPTPKPLAKQSSEQLSKQINIHDTIENNQFTFEYIDHKEKLVLPLLYRSMMEKISTDNIEKFTEYLYNKYSSNKEINKLLNSIKYIPDIPLELLSKYYARLYTIDSPFYTDINRELIENKKEKYLPYIKLLYEGAKLKSLPLAYYNILYRGSRISNDEIIKIKNYLKNKIKDFPGPIIFSKTFLSFTKDKSIVEQYLNIKTENENLFKVVYILEKDDKIDYSLSTHCDMENISIHPKDKEVLFFPFSCFEIKCINETIYNNEKMFEINLLYLCKYIKEIECITYK